MKKKVKVIRKEINTYNDTGKKTVRLILDNGDIIDTSEDINDLIEKRKIYDIEGLPISDGYWHIDDLLCDVEVDINDNKTCD